MDDVNAEVDTLAALVGLERLSAREKATLFRRIDQELQARNALGARHTGARNPPRYWVRFGAGALAAVFAIFAPVSQHGSNSDFQQARTRAASVPARPMVAATAVVEAGESELHPGTVEGRTMVWCPTPRHRSARNRGSRRSARSQAPEPGAPPPTSSPDAPPAGEDAVARSMSTVVLPPAGMAMPDYDTRARDGARRKQLIDEAAARHIAALGERARTASATRPLSSSAWF